MVSELSCWKNPKEDKQWSPHYHNADLLAKVNISSSTSKKHEKLGDASNFVAWKFRLEIIAENNDVLEYVQWWIPEPPENGSDSIKNR